MNELFDDVNDLNISDLLHIPITINNNNFLNFDFVFLIFNIYIKQEIYENEKYYCFTEFRDKIIKKQVQIKKYKHNFLNSKIIIINKNSYFNLDCLFLICYKELNLMIKLKNFILLNIIPNINNNFLNNNILNENENLLNENNNEVNNNNIINNKENLIIKNKQIYDSNIKKEIPEIVNNKKRKNKKKNNNKNKKIKEITKEKNLKKEIKKENINKILNPLFEKYDNSNIEKVYLGNINMMSEKNREIILQHNSLRNNTQSLEAAENKEEDFFKVFTEISNCCNIKFTHLLYTHFKNNPQEIILLIDAITKNNKKTDNLKELNELNINNISEKHQLFIKDKNYISDLTWKNIFKEINIKNIETDFTNLKKEINTEIIEYFNVKKILNGFTININKVITSLIKAHLHFIYKRIEKGKIINENLPDIIKIKLSMDGRTINNLRTVVVTLNILNLCSFGTQQRNCIIPVAMYIGEEKEIKEYTKEFINQIKYIKEYGINIEKEEKDASLFKDNFKIKVMFFWISDLASLSYISDLKKDGKFCIKCNCKRCNNLTNYSTGPNNLNHYLLIDDCNIIFCILHCDERITEYLLKLCISNEKEEKIIENNLQKLGGPFSKFTFKSKKVDEEAISVLDNTEYNFMLTGPQLKLFFNNFNKVFNNIKLTENKINCWKHWKYIRKFLYYTNQQLEEQNNEFNKLKEEIELYYKSLALIRTNNGTIGDYNHIIISHFIDILQIFGSLTPYSNEGVENSHQLDRLIIERSTARGKIKTNEENDSNDYFNYDTFIGECDNFNDLYQILQIILKKLRILYLSFTEEECTFENIEIRTSEKMYIKYTKEDNLQYNLPQNTLQETNNEITEIPLRIETMISNESIILEINGPKCVPNIVSQDHGEGIVGSSQSSRYGDWEM
ncbi:hypothetical protein ABK040_003778 [Willaertia magna]